MHHEITSARPRDSASTASSAGQTLGPLPRHEGGSQKSGMKENEGIGHDGVRQDVVPAIPELPENMPRLSAAASFPGSQQRGVALAAGSRHQPKESGPESIAPQQPTEPLELPVTRKSIRLAQNHAPGKKAGQPNPDPCRPGKLRLLKKKPCLATRQGRQGRNLERCQMRKRSHPQIAEKFR